MIRIEQCKDDKSAKGYYTTGDYYAGDRQELPGWWGGKAAERLGLRGMIHKRAFDRLCSNLHPLTGKKLTARMRAGRTPGYDINFHACKSVSILYGLTGNPDILAAFRAAYRETMAAMEAEMKTRVRKGGRCEDRVIGNMAWAEYVHLTSRPVNGLIDPHLHVHCFALNTVFDPVEQCWKAGTFCDLKRNAPRFQAMFHDLFGKKLSALGFPIERTKGGWEITGIDRVTIDTFSTRTMHINQVANNWGITDAVAKSKLGASTREHKQRDITLPQLRQQWRQRLTDGERAMLEQSIPRPLRALSAWEEERRGFILHRQRQASHQAAIAIAGGLNGR